jgi:transcription factor MYB, plant
VWNTHLKKKVKQREQQQKAGAATPITSSSASSSTTTANSSGEQCGTSKEPDALDIPPLETDIDILDMLVDELPAAEPMPLPSPCSSSSLTTCVGGGVEDLIELPVIDIDQEIWSIIDGAFLPGDSGATSGEAGEASDWWLENLEKELGLWGPSEYSQAQSDLLLGEMGGFTVPLGKTEGDPVSTYSQSGPAAVLL